MEEEKKEEQHEITTKVIERPEKSGGEDEYGEATVPRINKPDVEYLIPGLSSRDSLTTILSYLPIKDLVNACKLNRFGFHLVMDEDVRTKILSWELDKTEETRINNYLISLIQTTDENE